eukprot:10658206-Alexandrium_andersonii.AAC.1
MVNDLFEDEKDSRGKNTGGSVILENPPPLFTQPIEQLCAAVEFWPERCVILGAEGSQWPFMRGVGYNTFKRHLNTIGAALTARG